MGSALNVARITTGKNQNRFWRVLETDPYKTNFQSVGNKAGNFMFSISSFFGLELHNFRTKINCIHNAFSSERIAEIFLLTWCVGHMALLLVLAFKMYKRSKGHDKLLALFSIYKII